MCEKYSYEDKYLKYKAKYLALKKIQQGGSKRRVYFINTSVFFTYGYNSTSIFINKRLIEILPKNIQDLGYVYMDEDTNNVVIPEDFIDIVKEKIGDFTTKIKKTATNIAQKFKTSKEKQVGGYSFTIKTSLKLNTTNEVIDINNIYKELNSTLRRGNSTDSRSALFDGYIVVGEKQGKQTIINSVLNDANLNETMSLSVKRPLPPIKKP